MVIKPDGVFRVEKMIVVLFLSQHTRNKKYLFPIEWKVLVLRFIF